MNLLKTAKKQKSLKTLMKAMKCLDLDTVLSGDATFTLFAPADVAFARLPASTIEALFREKSLLNDVLTYHMVQGKVILADLKKSVSVQSVQGELITITKSANGATINGIEFLQKDIACTNGIIHVIDAVLFPEELQSADADHIKINFQKEGKA